MAMCRVTTVKSARQDQGKCGSCRTPILAGDGYRWWKGRYTPKYIRCMRSSCSPKPWELETNSLLSEGMQGEAQLDDAQSCTEDATSAASYLRDAISTAESVRDQLQERIDNKQGTPFEYGSEVEALQGSLDSFEDWLSQAETVADELEALDPAPTEDDYSPDSYQDDDDPEQAAQDAFDEAMQAYTESVEECLSGLDDWPEIDLGSYGPPRRSRAKRS